MLLFCWDNLSFNCVFVYSVDNVLGMGHFKKNVTWTMVRTVGRGGLLKALLHFTFQQCLYISFEQMTHRRRELRHEPSVAYFIMNFKKCFDVPVLEVDVTRMPNLK